MAIDRTFLTLPPDAADRAASGRRARRESASPLRWDDLLQSDRVLVVAPAGFGKTTECRHQQRRLWDRGEPAFFLELATLSAQPLDDQLGEEEKRRLEHWRSSETETATFFLDSIDELKLTHGSFRVALNRLANAIGGRSSRARLVFTSRPIPFDRDLVAERLPLPDRRVARLTDDQFAALAMRQARSNQPTERPPSTRVVELCPLSDAQIAAFAIGQGVTDPRAFLDDIHRRGFLEFAERPIDLIELCRGWPTRQWPDTDKALIAGAVAAKLQPRTDRREGAELSPQRAREGASRLALASVLTRRLTIRHSAESDTADASDAAIDPAELLHDWNPAEQRTLLERPLFGHASIGRVRFHHRSVIEFLAAERLACHLALGRPIATIKRLLLTATATGDKIVKPTMRPIAAWLALDDDSIFAAVIERDPAIMLVHGDPASLSLGQKEIVLRAYASRDGQGGGRGLHVPALQRRLLADPGLAPVLRDLWPKLQNPELKQLVLDLIGAGRVADCADLASDAALSPVELSRIRLSALTALADVSDARLPGLVASLTAGGPAWSDEMTRAAIVRLFPAHLDVRGLLAILPRISPSPDLVDSLTYELPRLIQRHRSKSDLEALARGLSALVADGMAWTANWPHYESPRTFLRPALAAACERCLSLGAACSDLADAIATAMRPSERSGPADPCVQALGDRVNELAPPDRALLFWAEDRFRQATHPESAPTDRFWEAAYHGPLRFDPKRDAPWLLAALRDRSRPTAERATILHGLMFRRWELEPEADDVLQCIRAEIADDAELGTQLESLLAPPLPPDPRQLALVTEREKQDAKAAKERKGAAERWKHFRQELLQRPEHMFSPEHSENTAWNLWHFMEGRDEIPLALGWDLRFLAAQFSNDIVDRLRGALRPVWRNARPTLWSERPSGGKNTYLVRWAFGLAALAAEADEPGWATRLTADEASLACRYALIQLNKAPTWLDDLVSTWPGEVEQTVGAEIDAQLQLLSSGAIGDLLTRLSDASEAIRALARPKLLAWLTAGGDLPADTDNGVATLEEILNVLLQPGDPAINDVLRQLAERRRQQAVGRRAAIWLVLLLRLDPSVGLSALEMALDEAQGADPTGPATLVATIFDDSNRLHFGFHTANGWTPALLLRLVDLLCRHIPLADDRRRVGAYTPDDRDRAEYARSMALDALLRTEGVEGWHAKRMLAGRPDFAPMRDRLHRLADERAAEEAEGLPASLAAVLGLEQSGVLSPATPGDMLQLMHDRLDDLHDLLLQDGSPREAWARLDDERLIRRSLSHELQRDRRGAYDVVQEAVTADEKETDIRLRSAVDPGQEGVIEIKVAEKNRSALDLRDALADQLIQKYLAPERRRAGILLITAATDRRWRHPDTGASMDLAGLIRYLDAEARRLMRDHGGILHVAVRSLDLRPRLAAAPPSRKPRA